ncbi:MAG: fimbrillin family protein [Alistipes sp.]|nr:fimbrillin family protein [Alistipes sp.]
MKKLLFGVFAVLAMIACNRDEVVDVQQSSFITFGDSFVEVKTRAAADPSTTTASISAFDVWGFIGQPSGTVFNKERVTKGENGWSYQNLQYWTPEDKFYFHAVSPVDDSNIVVDTKEMNTEGLGNIAFTNVNGTTDLLYATLPIETGNVFPYYDDEVTLKFMHLLSKIKFTFKNGFTNENTSLVVKNIKIVNAPAKGNIDVNKSRLDFVWNLTQGEFTELAFGDVNGGNPMPLYSAEKVENGVFDPECAVERLTIPADNTRAYTIEFDLALYYGDQLGMESHKEICLEDQAFEIGKNYNLVATINAENFADEALKAIEFDVVVEDWVEGEFTGDFHEKHPEVQPVALATPEVKTEVDVNVVTLTWNAVEGASHYTVQVDDDVEEVVNDTTYTFEGDYEVEYTFTVKAIAADAEKNLDSEAAVVKVTTEAKPQEPVVEPTYTTVAEFLAASVDANVEYTLKGTITAVANTTFGNFDLTDETGTVYIYGLNSPDGATNKYWATSGAKLGDDIIIKTVRAEFNGSAQGSNAKFVELLPGTLAFWSFDKDNVVFGSSDAAEQTVNVVAYNTTEEIKVASNNAQFSTSYADGVITIVAAENTLTEKIEGIVTVTCGSLSKEITVSQAAYVEPGQGLTKGEQYTYTFTKSVFSANGTKALGDLNWTVAGDGGYWGWDSQNGKGQQFGSSNKPYTALTISTEDYTEGVETITLTTSGASSTNAKVEVYVGGVKLGQTVSLATTSKDYTFSNNGEILAGKIELKYTQTSKKAIYLKGITIN